MQRTIKAADNYVIIAEAEDAGKRIDVFLLEKMPELLAEEIPSFSRSGIQKWISEGRVTCNGQGIQKNYRLSPKDRIYLSIPDVRVTKILPENLPLAIVYEDVDLLVINKPKGMVVHPAAGHESGTLVNALMHHCRDSLSGINGERRPGIVHRIDKDTSGLLVVAKNNAAHLFLAKQLVNHSMERQYQAVCHGVFKETNGVVDRPIGRDRKDRKKFAVDEKNGKRAVTGYSLLENYLKYSHLWLCLETGRTHQIRVHMASIGHPVAGDLIYGPRSTPRELNGQCLHAKTLGFIHPRTKEKMMFDSELPEYFTGFIKKAAKGEGYDEKT